MVGGAVCGSMTEYEPNGATNRRDWCEMSCDKNVAVITSVKLCMKSKESQPRSAVHCLECRLISN